VSLLQSLSHDRVNNNCSKKRSFLEHFTQYISAYHGDCSNFHINGKGCECLIGLYLRNILIISWRPQKIRDFELSQSTEWT